MTEREVAVTVKFKLISSNRFDLFEERLADFGAALAADDIIVDIKFATAAISATIEYSALIHYQTTERWA
jgi:hypothetical protein